MTWFRRWFRRWFSVCPCCRARSKAEVNDLIVCAVCALPTEVLR